MLDLHLKGSLFLVGIKLDVLGTLRCQLEQFLSQTFVSHLSTAIEMSNKVHPSVFIFIKSLGRVGDESRNLVNRRVTGPQTKLFVRQQMEVVYKLQDSPLEGLLV